MFSLYAEYQLRLFCMKPFGNHGLYDKVLSYVSQGADCQALHCIRVFLRGLNVSVLPFTAKSQDCTYICLISIQNFHFI